MESSETFSGVAADDPAADQPLEWARAAAWKRTPVRVSDAGVPVALTAYSRDDGDVYRCLGRVAGSA